MLILFKCVVVSISFSLFILFFSFSPFSFSWILPIILLADQADVLILTGGILNQYEHTGTVLTHFAVCETAVLLHIRKYSITEECHILLSTPLCFLVGIKLLMIFICLWFHLLFQQHVKAEIYLIKLFSEVTWINFLLCSCMRKELIDSFKILIYIYMYLIYFRFGDGSHLYMNVRRCMEKILGDKEL